MLSTNYTRSCHNHSTGFSAITPTAETRKGAALVEFSLVLPLVLLLATGVLELGEIARCTTALHAAVREAGRLASMSESGGLNGNQTLNQKVESDLKAVMAVRGYDPNSIRVSITDADTGAVFDLTGPTNRHRDFRLSAEVDYSQTGHLLSFAAPDTLDASIVFRFSGGAFAQ